MNIVTTTPDPIAEAPPVARSAPVKHTVFFSDPMTAAMKALGMT